MKLRPKFYGLYKVKSVKPHNRYEVDKVGLHQEPNLKSTAADHME